MNVFNQTKYRSVSLEKNFSFFINCDLDTVTGSSVIGFSGDNGFQPIFNFSSGYIYDFNKRYVYSYNPNEIIEISGNVGSDYINYFINNKPVCLFAPFSGNFYKYFYVSSDNANLSLDFFLNANKRPEYEIQFNQPIDLGSNVTGFIRNLYSDPKFQIQLFSGRFINQNYYNLSGIDKNFISGGRSGLLTLNYVNLLNPDTFFTTSNPLNQISGLLILNTNFGNISQEIVLSVKNRAFYSLDFEDPSIQILGTSPNLTFTYNYQLFVKAADFNSNITFTVTNFSGHNQEQVSGNFLCTGNLTGISSGFIYGRDYLTGLLQGTLTSTIKDFNDNSLSTQLISPYQDLRYATGNINYNYRILLQGGSGFGPPNSNISIPASGTGAFNSTNFIFKQRLLTGTGITNLSGTYQNVLQSQNKITNLTGTGFFTGNFNLNYSLLRWSGLVTTLTGSKFVNIHGITGFNNYNFTNSNSGTINLSNNLTITQTGAVILNPIIPFGSRSEFESSPFSNFPFEASEDNFNGLFVFFPEEDGNNWTMINNTGFIEFNFSLFDPQFKIPITHYLLNVNFENSNYQPYVFSLLGRNNINDNFQVLDQRTGQNFYSSNERIFTVQNPNYYNYIRLVLSGAPWEHINYTDQNILPTVSLNKFYFFSTGGRFQTTGLRSIFNNVTGNTFVVQENGINYTGRITTPAPSTQSPVENQKAWNAFNLENTAHIYGKINGTNLNVELPRQISGQLSGYYIKFQNGYKPFNLSLSSSTSSLSSYTTILDTTIDESTNFGFLTSPTGTKFLNFLFSYDSTDPLLPIFNTVNNGHLLRSFNSGLTWSLTSNDKAWSSISMSKDGKVLVGTTLNDFIYVSYNSGASWNSRISIDNWYSSAVSNNFVIVGKEDELFFSNNSGNQFFSLNGLVLDQWGGSPIDFTPTKLAISDDFSILAFIDSNTNKIYYSRPNDFGDYIFIPIESLPTSPWSSLSVSTNGYYIYASQASGFIYQIDPIETESPVAVLDDKPRNWSSVSSSNIFVAAVEKGGSLYYRDQTFSWFEFTGDSINSIPRTNWETVQVFGNSQTGLFLTASMDSAWVMPTLSNINVNYPISNWKEGITSNNGDLQLLRFDPKYDIRIDYINIYTTGLNQQTSKTNQVYGYGNVNSRITGFSFDTLNNLTGNFLQSAVLIKTGLLQTGLTTDNLGVASWELNIQETGSANNVFSTYISQQTRATGIIEFINATGSGLSIGDTITINSPFNNQFTYTYNDAGANTFNALTGLVNLINNSFPSLISGSLDNNKIIVVDRNNIGETGNLFRISRTASNINAIKIPNRYFQGGITNRTLFNSWAGNFSFNNTVTTEHSGFYFEPTTISAQTGISGLIWENSLRSWSVFTGSRAPGSPLIYPNKLNYISTITGYSGNTIILSGGSNTALPSGFNFRITRNNPNINLYNGSVLYVMNISTPTGQTVYSGVLRG